MKSDWHFYQQLTKHTSFVIDKLMGSSSTLYFPILYLSTHFTEFSACFAKTDQKRLRKYWQSHHALTCHLMISLMTCQYSYIQRSKLYFYTTWSHNHNEDHIFQSSSWWAGEMLQDRKKRHINLLISYRSRKFLFQQLFFISPYFPVSGPSFCLFSLSFFPRAGRKHTVVWEGGSQHLSYCSLC